MRKARTVWVAVGIAGLLAGCTGQLGSGEAALGDDVPEVVVSSEELLEGFATEGDWLVSPVLEAGEGATRVGVLLGLNEAGELPVMEARPIVDGAPTGDWVRLAATWSEVDHHVAIADFETMAMGAQLRVRAADSTRIQLVRWSAVVPEVIEEAPTAGDDEIAGASAALRSELTGLGIVTRSAWGARATRCTSGDSRKTKMAIHHTVTPSSDPQRQLRGIQRYHMDSRGWCDVGYHFLIGSDGRVYEGRPLHLLGAHVASNNTGNIGISFIGCFHSSGCGSMGPTRPPDSMVRIAGQLVGTLSRLYGISVNSDRVRGHRDHPGQGTSCPGDHLHARLGELRTIGSRERLGGGTTTPPPPPPPSTGGSCTHTYGGVYANRGCSPSYQCCDGRWSSRGACGACACTESTGRIGCSAPSGPPPGASCTHTYGGAYANTACSPSYQCCNGRWGARGSCGSCYCEESTGRIGCGT